VSELRRVPSASRKTHVFHFLYWHHPYTRCENISIFFVALQLSSQKNYSYVEKNERGRLPPYPATPKLRLGKEYWIRPTCQTEIMHTRARNSAIYNSFPLQMVVNCQLHAVVVLATYTPLPNRRSWTEGRVGLRAGLDVVSKTFLFLTGNQFCRQITLKFQPIMYNQTCSNRPAVYPPSPATDRITITVPLIPISRQRWRQMYVCEEA